MLCDVKFHDTARFWLRHLVTLTDNNTFESTNLEHLINAKYNLKILKTISLLFFHSSSSFVLLSSFIITTRRIRLLFLIKDSRLLL